MHLVYVSTATNLITQGEIDRILEASRRNNEQVGITGLLLYNGRRFLQALEGSELDVRTTYERIKADPRHRGLTIIASRENGERMFGDWAMAARRVGGDTDLDDLRAQVDAMTADLAPSLRAHFNRYVDMAPE